MLKRVLVALLGLLVLAAVGGGIFVATRISAFDESMEKKYDVPLREVKRSTDPEVLARGKHLVESLGGCPECHGPNLGGGRIVAMGPVAHFRYSNITTGKNGLDGYTDAELDRLLKHGIKRDGRSVRFMPSQDYAWWPADDLTAVISYLRTVPAVDGEPASAEIKPMGKVLDRLDLFTLDVARRIDHRTSIEAGKPAPTAEYGAWVAGACKGCHGARLSGGRIPGAPPELPIPTNLTPHESGLKGWTFEEFEKTLRTGVRKNGKPLDPFMPVGALKNFDENEMRGLFLYLQSLPPLEFGQR